MKMAEGRLTGEAVRKFREAIEETYRGPVTQQWLMKPDLEKWFARWHYRLALNVRFEPRDLWVGAYWQVDPITEYGTNVAVQEEWWHLYLCIVPLLPIHFTLKLRRVIVAPEGDNDDRVPDRQG